MSTAPITSITIRPDREINDIARFPSSATRLVGERRQSAPSTTTADASFLGEDGLTFRDVFDTINPLEHIPLVSDLFDSATGHTPCVAAKLAGGALLGGPIGFLAALGNVIFQQETGHGTVGAVLAAVTGSDEAATTQVASASDVVDDTAVEEQETAQAAVPAVPVEVANIAVPPTAILSATAPTPAPTGDDADVLSLYGAEAKSAHASYRKAQFRPYLNDVTHSALL